VSARSRTGGGAATAKRDFYEVLGVARSATTTEIKSAYRRIAIQNHPDRNPGDPAAEERFKEAAEAYAVLSDAGRRARYDQFGHASVGGAGGPAGFDPTIFADFSDILGDLFGFGDLFGGGRRRGGPNQAQAGADLRYDLEITFEQAAFGHTVPIEIPRLETCGDCRGTGGEGGKPPVACTACGGRGQVRFQQGFLTIARPCPQCRGAGSMVKDPCPTCRGEGRVEARRSLELKVPAGVDHGSRLRLVGEGEHGRNGGPPGDLYVVLEVAPHPSFSRDGIDVLAGAEISYALAVLGGEVEVPTLHGPANLELPAGTQPGRQFRLKNQGIPRLDGRGRGDHLVTVTLRVPNPRELGDERVATLRAWAQADGEAVAEGSRVLKKVKSLFN
jgi:molecular chaperone DnaJ